MTKRVDLFSAALASLIFMVAPLNACDKSPTTTEGESAEQTDEPTEAEPDKDVEMAATNLPGVDQMPASTKEKLDEALAAKKQKTDPTYETRHKDDEGLPTYVNRLILASSPYLQQHAHNPTNWFMWGEEAFEKAKRENKPVLLSVGYSTCHWCHVMAKESFDDAEIAEYLNEHYVTIKVDREQRPDIDDRYMSAVRMMSGGGGWPMTVWMTPNKLPFMGGTYFPPQRFLSLLKKMNRQYEESPSEIRQRAQKTASRVHEQMSGAGQSDAFPDAATAMERAYRMLKRGFDDAHGGWGRRNKFPMPSRLQFLLRYHKRTGEERALKMVTKSLDGMANGGIYDHLGGGFHRYTVDSEWLVPHFEKMLYTNGQLALTYTEAWQATQNPEYARVVEETLNYLQREMVSPEGALYAATHANSRVKPGGKLKEGAFFLWSPEEIRQVLTDKQAKLVNAYYNVTKSGNHEGKNVLHTPRSRDAVAEELGLDRSTFDDRLERARKKLRIARDNRPNPPLDDNIITAWNGLALEAFARAALVFGDDRWLEQARAIGDYILSNLQTDDGMLLRSRTEGKAGSRAYSTDYAFAIAGLLNLYEASSETRWLKAAEELQRQHLEHYWDDKHGGFYQTAAGSDVPITRQKGDRDGSTPTSNSYAALNLFKLYQFRLDESFQKRGKDVLEAFGETLETRGARLSRMLVALDFIDAKPREIAFVKPSEDSLNPMMNTYRKTFLPNAVLVRTEDPSIPNLKETIPWMEKKETKKGESTAYVCRDFTCKYPTTEPSTFEDQISEVTPLE